MILPQRYMLYLAHYSNDILWIHSRPRPYLVYGARSVLTSVGIDVSNQPVLIFQPLILERRIAASHFPFSSANHTSVITSSIDHVYLSLHL